MGSFHSSNDAEDKGLRHGGLDDVGNLYEKLTIVKRSEYRRPRFANRPTTEVPPLRGSERKSDKAEETLQPERNSLRMQGKRRARCGFQRPVESI